MADLRSVIAEVRAGGGQRDVTCPAHDDRRDSLSVGPGRDQPVVLYCHAGCEHAAILAAGGVPRDDMRPERESAPSRGEIEKTYDHRDETGRLLFQSVRFTPKGFRLRRPDGAGGWVWNLDGVERVPYALERLADSTPDLWVVEGHKDADRLWQIGLPATTSPQGASDWQDAYTDHLIRIAGVERVFILPDHDRAGWGYGHQVAASFDARSVTVRVVTLPGIHDGPPAAKHGRDVSDFLDGGHSADTLRAHAKTPAVWTPPDVTAPAVVPGSGTDTAAGGDALAIQREERVVAEMEKERVRRDARSRLEAEARGPLTPPEIATLRDRLTRPAEPIPWRTTGWQTRDSRVLMTAQGKVGKTTVLANLIRSLVDGDLWLDAYPVVPVDGAVALLDFEMAPGQLDSWLRAQQIRNDDRVLLISLRGQGAAFNILDARVRAEWATRFRQRRVQYLMVDCLRPVLDAIGLDEHRDAGQFLVAFDALLRDAGIPEALIVHHMGHTAERARGDSRLRDWPDVEWRLTRPQHDDAAASRYITAYGRDVDIPERQLVYDTARRRLTIQDGSRQDAKTSGALLAVLEVLKTATEPLSGRAIKTALDGSDHGRNQIDAALALGSRKGDLTVEPGPRHSKLYRGRVSQCPEVSHDCPGNDPSECPAPLLGGDTGILPNESAQAKKSRDTRPGSADKPEPRQSGPRKRKLSRSHTPEIAPPGKDGVRVSPTPSFIEVRGNGRSPTHAREPRS